METITDLVACTDRIPEQFVQGYADGLNVKPGVHSRRIVCAGMGGSILGAELFLAYARRENLPLDVTVWQTYDLPSQASSRKPMVYCISYSGNTEETLSAFAAARKQNLPVAALSVNGMLLKKAKQAGILHPVMPDTIMPRLSASYVFGFLSAIHAPTSVRPVSLPLDAVKRQARALALALRKKQCLVYTTPDLMSLAHAWEINLNETAKALAFADDIPDVDHHALAALAAHKGTTAFAAVILRDPAQTSHMRARIALSRSALVRAGVQTAVIDLWGKTTREKLLFGTALAQYTSLELARITRADPFENTVQEKFKKTLRNKK